MSYITVKNIETDTSYRQEDWSLFVLKELMDNAYDWLNSYHPVKKSKVESINRNIGIRIWMTSDSNIHIAVRNSNVNNEPVFPELEKVFDYHIWYSTKRYQHNMTTGSLGDALKRCLGMGYAIHTNDFDASETFEDKQWNEPIIIRCNQKEFKVFLKVDTSKPDVETDILQEEKPSRDIGNDTEVEVTLPLQYCSEPFEYATHNKEYVLSRLKQRYQSSKIAKRNIIFDFYCQGSQ